MEVSLLNGFAAPEVFDQRLRDQLSNAYVEALIEEYLTSFSSVLNKDSANSTKALLAVRDVADPQTLWRPGFGRLRQSLKTSNGQTALRALAEVLYHTPTDIDCWEVCMPAPVPVLLGNTVYAAVVSLKRREETYLVNGIPLDMASQSHSLLSIESVSRQGHQILLFGGAAAAAYAPYGTGSVLPTVGADFMHSLGDALDLLKTSAIDYFTWVSKGAYRLLITSTEGGRITSGTISLHFGELFISDVKDKTVIAEMLVHECSHQYLTLLTTLGSTIAEDHQVEYFSPFPQKMRTLDKLLLAYHAFANVRGMYELCAPETLDHGPYRQMMLDLSTTEATLLAQRSHLTDLGLSIFEPLHEIHGVFR